MSDSEFKVQVIETTAQWQSGLWSSLDFNSDGLSLFLTPVFDSWIIPQRTGFRGGDIVVDECGQTYWTAREIGNQRHQEIWKLFRYNPTTNQIELVLTFAGCGEINPTELWLDENYLWVFDRKISEGDREPLPTGRMLALSRDNWQIILEFDIEDLIDIDFQPNGYFYAVTKTNCRTQVCRYSTTGPCGKSKCFTINTSIDPVGVAVSKEGMVYLYDAGRGRFIQFDPETKQETILCIPPDNLPADFQPTAMQIDARGVLFMAGSNPASLYTFDKDGSYLDKAELPPNINRIDGIGFDRSGGVLLATDLGLAKLLLTKNPVGHSGSFYSKTLDNGQPQSFWHRIALLGRIPAKSSVEVYTTQVTTKRSNLFTTSRLMEPIQLNRELLKSIVLSIRSGSGRKFSRD